MEGISDLKDSSNAMNDEVQTSEGNHKIFVGGERYLGRERRGWISDRTKGICVIWCGRMPFWNLVVGAVGLRATGIWVGNEVWRRQSRRWCPGTFWNNERVEGSEYCWGEDWVLAEADMLP